MSEEEQYIELSDEQCGEYRRMPLNFNDMVRAIYKDGWREGYDTRRI